MARIRVNTAIGPILVNIAGNEPTEEVKVCLNDETNYDINEVPRQYLIRFLEMLTLLRNT